MALPLCTCSPKSVTPASCPCVFDGLAGIFPVKCSKCNAQDWGAYPINWKAIYCKCPNCGHGGWVVKRDIDEYLGGADWDLAPEVEDSPEEREDPWTRERVQR
jgi:hypothetical protein